jgi:hypothetical protein
MNILFLPSRAPSLHERYLISEKYAASVNLNHQGILSMIESQLLRKVITEYTLNVAAMYHNRFCEILQKTNSNYEQLMNSDINIAICLVTIDIAIKMTEDTPVIYFGEVIQYYNLGFFEECMTSEEFNFLECEILQRLEFNLAIPSSLIYLP